MNNSTFIDSFEYCAKGFDFNVDKHQFFNDAVVVKSRKNEEFPDGMFIDSEAMLWVPFWGGKRVGRYNPKQVLSQRIT